MSFYKVILLFFVIGSVATAAIKNGIRDDAPRGGNMVFNMEGEPPVLNPITSTDAYASNVQAYTDDSLATRDPNTYEWKPRIAEKWEISKDNKVFTFFLRKDAFFHDGKPITAEDVKFSFDVIFDPKYDTASKRPYYEGIAKVEVIDPYTVRFTAKDTYFKNFDVSAGIDVLPKHIYGDPENVKKMNKTIVAAGPYTFAQYDKGSKIVLKKFDKWYGSNLPEYKGTYNYDQITFRFIKEETIQLESLKKGDIDYVLMRTPEVYVKKAVGPLWGTKVFKYKVEDFASKPYGYVGWNLRNPMFQNKDVRVALAHLMNRDEMNKKFRDGMSYLATGPLFLKSDYANQKVKPFLYDPKLAGELLAKAGWKDSNKNGTLDKDGQEFSFTLMYANQNNEKYWTMYKEDLKKAGINMELKYQEWNSFLKAVDDAKFEAIAMSWGGGDINWDPKQIWHSASAASGGSNFINYKNPEVDKLIDEARVEMSKTKRAEKLQKVYELIAADAPYVFMFNDRYTFYGTTARVKKAADTLKYDTGSDYWWLEK